MKGILNSPVIYLWRNMYKYAEGRRKKFWLTTTLFISANIIDAVQPLIFAYFLNFLQKNPLNQDSLLKVFLILLLFLLTEAVFWALWAPARILEQKNAFFIKKRYKEYLLKGVMDLPLSWHADHHSGDTIDKIEKGSSAIFSFSSDEFMYIKSFTRLVTSFGALIYFSFYPSLIVVLISIFAFYVMFRYDKKLTVGYRIVNKLENKISERVYDVISNITTVIILRIEKLVFKTIEKSIDAPYPQFKENVLNNEKKWYSASLLGQLAVILMIFFYLLLEVGHGQIVLIGSIYILYSYSTKVKDTFFNFAQLYGVSVRQKTNMQNAEEISEEFIKIESIKNKHLPKVWSTISIKNLSFSYHEDAGSDLHLDNVNLEINKGQKIAVIGESGGGKTTFLKIFRGLYTPKNMSLEIDQKILGESFNVISESISLIPQDPEIFTTTIRENITLGVEYKDQEVNSYTDMAVFSEVVARLPHGLESNIVEKGVNLSGGEKQRLALARGLLASKDKDIVLLDEPTSSVDFHNELKIYENIFSSMPEKTIISSIHRLHLLSLFDNIFFFKDGKIVASGNLETLKKDSEDFQKLWDKYLKTQNQ